MGAMDKHPKIKMLETGAAGLAGLVVLRLALKPVSLPFGLHFSLSWLLIPVRLLLRLALWMSWRVTKLALLTIICNFVWKAVQLLWNIIMSNDKSSDVPHDCIPPPGWRYQDQGVQEETVALIKQSHPELVDLAAAGTLIAIEPRKMLVRALEQLQEGGCGGEGGQLLQGSEVLDACLAAAVPELIFVVGTVHVSQQSAKDVKRVVKAIRPQLVVLELCAPRLQAVLVDPFADPLHDLEPCPERLAAVEASRHKSVASVLKAALASRDHNVLSTVMSGLFSLLAEKLQAQVGTDFLAARAAMIELLEQEEQGRSRRSPATLLSLLRGDGQRSSTTGSSAAQPAVEAADQRSCSWSSSSSAASSAAGDDAAAAGCSATQPVMFAAETVSEQRLLMEQVGRGAKTNWLHRCLPGDRPVTETLKAIWAALKPQRRLAFMWDLLSGLGDVNADLIKSLGSEDVVELLMTELGTEFPELLKPLLHDRNWLLATTAWRAAQWSAQPGQPVLAVVGRGHLGGMLFVVQRLVQHVAALSLRAAAEEEQASAEEEAAAAKAEAEAGLVVAAEQQ